jgi:hypothetical protein
MRKIVYITGALFAMLQVLAGVFKILHWPGAESLVILSTGMALIFIPALARYLFSRGV